MADPIHDVTRLLPMPTDPIHEVTRLLPELTSSDQIARCDRKSVEEALRWLLEPADRTPREIARQEVAYLHRRINGLCYRDRQKGRETLRAVMHSFEELS